MTGDADRVRGAVGGIAALTIALLVGTAGCVRSNDPAHGLSTSVLRIGYGLTTGSEAESGVRQVAMILALEGLVTFGLDARPQARLAKQWETSADGLSLRVALTPGVIFHDGTPANASTIRELLAALLPQLLGGAVEDIREILVVNEFTLEILLNRRSTFLLEGLGVPLQLAGNTPVGTGPFRVASVEGDRITMAANEDYHLGQPLIEQVTITPYSSVRSAWAEMLRGEVDMLYEVGVDAVDLLEPSRDVNVFTVPRPYATAIILNTKKAHFRDPERRRALNAAIDRQGLIDGVLNGYGTPAYSPLWPYHWASDEEFPRFGYDPRPVSTSSESTGFTLLYAEPSHELVALHLQRQFLEVGIRVELEVATLDSALDSVRRGDFEAFLADAGLGPMLLRPYLFWYTDGPLNWGGYSSPETDGAFDDLRSAEDDTAYRAAMARLQQAIVDDPPAIFLTWSRRARAVSTRFEVPRGQEGDIFPSTLRLWRPAPSRTSIRD